MKYKIQCRLKRCVLFLILFSAALPHVCAQTTKTPLYFYAVSSTSGDSAVIKMTQDLLFSQLASLDLFTVYDKRDTEYSASQSAEHTASGALVFYAAIYEKDGEWFSELHLAEAAGGKETVLQNNYDGYYKILTEAKNALTSLIKQFASGTQTPQPKAAASINAESLSGTWYGEEYIDKIIFLRGGRGFVIFKNGASMNISVSISGKTVIAVQQSKPNASFFPELPRETALINAVDAEPIRWEMTVENESTMQGIKLSLVAEYDEQGSVSVKRGSIPVRWHR